MLKQKIEEIIKNETIKSQIKSHLPLQERATNLYPSQEGHIKQLAQSLTSALELDEGKVAEVIYSLKNNRSELPPDSWVSKALCSKYKEGKLFTERRVV